MITSSETLSAELISFYRNTRDVQTNHAESKREADLRARIEQKQKFLQSLKRLVSGMNNLYIGTQAGQEDSVRGREIIKESNAIAQRLIENYNSQQALAMQRRTNWLLSACSGNSELRAKQKKERMLEVVRVQEQVIAELRSSRRMMEVEKDKQTVLTLEREIADIGRDITRSRQEYRQEEDRICRTLADLGASIGEQLLRRQEMNGIQSGPKQQQQKQQQQHQQLENGGCVDEDFTEAINAIVNTHEGEDASLQHEGDVSLMLLNESTSKYSFELEFKDPNDFPDLLKIMQPANSSYEKLVKKCQQSVDTAQIRKKKHHSRKQSRIGSQQEPAMEPAKKKQKQTVCKATPPNVAPREVLAERKDQENQCPLPSKEIDSSHNSPAKRFNRLAKTQDSTAGQHQQQQDQRTLRKRKALEPAIEVPEAGQIAGKEPKQKAAPPAVTESMFKEPLPVAAFTASGTKRRPKSQTVVPPKAPVKRSTPVEEVIAQKRPMKSPTSVAKVPSKEDFLSPNRATSSQSAARPMKPPRVAKVPSKEDFLSPNRASSSQSAAKGGTSNGAKVQEAEIFSSRENAPSKYTSSNSPPENPLENEEHRSMEETQDSDNSSIMMVESTSSNSMDYLLTSPSAEFDLNLSPEQSDNFDNDLDFLNDFDSNQRATSAGRKGAGETRKPNDRNEEQAEPDGFDFAFDDGLSSEQLDQRKDLF